jgi:AraC family transcriptional regulator
MEHRIVQLEPKTLVGMHLEMSYIKNQTGALWQSFMPNRHKISHKIDNKFYSMQVYDGLFDYKNFNPSNTFVKWATVEVSSVADLPDGMDVYTLSGGLYAVFHHIGPASVFHKTMTYIFEDWMPSSGYVVDDREHFEILEEGYNPMDENATEEVWIPIKAI